MANLAWPPSGSGGGLTAPGVLRSNELLRPAVGAGDLGLLPQLPLPIASAATTGIPIAVRPSALWADGGRLYIVSFGNPWGFQVADIATDPAEPVILGGIGGGPSPLCYQVKARTALGYAWRVCNSGSRLTRTDVSNPAAPFDVDFVACGAQPFGFGINADGTLAAVATTSTTVGLRIVDLTTMGIVGSLNDGTAYADARIEGDFAYCSGFLPGEMRVVDISDPSNPVLRGSVGGLTTNIRRINVLHGIVYLLCRDTGPQGGLMYVIDCTDPDAPVLVNTIDCPNTSDEASIELSGSLLFTSRTGGAPGGQQLRIWSLGDPSSPALQRLVQYSGAIQTVFAVSPSGDYCYCANRQFAPNNRVFTVKLR